MRVAMSDPRKKRNSPLRIDHKFTVRHQQKQLLLLRALEQMDTSGETPAESAAVTAMMVRLEALVANRQRRRSLDPAVPRRQRDRCTYGGRGKA
jgi:hypothetical protein